MIIHTTMAMQTAWKMYEQIGFKRSEDLDFMQAAKYRDEIKALQEKI